ncbi:MAG: hypothetical protein FWC27_05570 [Firmicutes bacterium]|nr:hypothetical protein [Bacillota bacterium]
MNPFDIFIVYISWGDGGKHRPVLVLALSDSEASALPITSQYENKSNAVRAKYCKIVNWKEAGLDKPSVYRYGNAHPLPRVGCPQESVHWNAVRGG